MFICVLSSINVNLEEFNPPFKDQSLQLPISRSSSYSLESKWLLCIFAFLPLLQFQPRLKRLGSSVFFFCECWEAIQAKFNFHWTSWNPKAKVCLVHKFFSLFPVDEHIRLFRRFPACLKPPCDRPKRQRAGPCLCLSSSSWKALALRADSANIASPAKAPKTIQKPCVFAS